MEIIFEGNIEAKIKDGELVCRNAVIEKQGDIVRVIGETNTHTVQSYNGTFNQTITNSIVAIGQVKNINAPINNIMRIDNVFIYVNGKELYIEDKDNSIEEIVYNGERIPVKKKNNLAPKKSTLRLDTTIDKITLDISGSVIIDDSVVSDNLELNMSGSGYLFFSANKKMESMTILLQGAGEIDIEVKEIDTLTARLKGAGNIFIECDKVNDLFLDLSGVGNINFEGCANTVHKNISGIGDIRFRKKC